MVDLPQLAAGLMIATGFLALAAYAIGALFRDAYKGAAPLSSVEAVHEFQKQAGARCYGCGRYFGHYDPPGFPRRCTSCLVKGAATLQPADSTDAIERGLACRRCSDPLQPLAHPCDCPRCRLATDDLIKQFAALKS